MSNQDNISPFAPGGGGKEKLSEDKLMAYLEGKLSNADQHEVELWLAEEGMEADALEGLRTLQPRDSQHTINKLKHDLRKRVVGKKHKRRPLRTNVYTWSAIAIILLLAVVAYIVMQMLK